MEGKKSLSATAAWCLLLAVVVVLSGEAPRPVAGMSKFCRCYKQCYADCRMDSGPYPCNFQCLQDCFNNAAQPAPAPARPKSAADCNRICLFRVCGVMSTVAGGGDSDAQACLVDCRSSIGLGHSAQLKDDTAN